MPALRGAVMQIVIMGCGYVGLVTGACLAEMGNQITCVDTDPGKLAQLRMGLVPFFEPGLEALVQRNVQQRRLVFAEDPRAALREAEIAFIAVGTPPLDNGSADTRQVFAAAADIARYAHPGCVIVNKSTAPVGTAEAIARLAASEAARRAGDPPFVVVSNPEFLREGAAVEDFMRPDRVVLGVEDARAEAVMRALYAPFIRNHERCLVMRRRDAELAKYAANAMLATRISFMNEIARLCSAVGADIEQVRRGVGSDARIGYSYLYAGCGYGGSCFPKDVRALAEMSRRAGIESGILSAVQRVNQLQKRWAFDLLTARFGRSLRGRRIAVWGLAFKPETDDLREAPAQLLIGDILDAGGEVFAHDPVAMPRARSEWPEAWFGSGWLQLAADPYAAAKGADALVLVTEWKPYRSPDFSRLKAGLRSPLIIDGRNQYDPQQMQALGFEYCGVGRGLPKPQRLQGSTPRRAALLTAC